MVVKKRDVSKKRNEILDAAIQAFGEKGFENASMDYIAELSTSSKRTVYNHFTSKDELFNAIFARFILEVVKVKEIQYLPNQRLALQLEKFVDAKITLLSNDKWLAILKISTGIFIAHPEVAKQAIENVMTLELPLINLIKAAAQDGKLVLENAELAANVFNSMLVGSLFWPTIIHGKIPQEKQLALKNEIISVFLAKYEVCKAVNKVTISNN